MVTPCLCKSSRLQEWRTTCWSSSKLSSISFVQWVSNTPRISIFTRVIPDNNLIGLKLSFKVLTFHVPMYVVVIFFVFWVFSVFLVFDFVHQADYYRIPYSPGLGVSPVVFHNSRSRCPKMSSIFGKSPRNIPSFYSGPGIALN